MFYTVVFLVLSISHLILQFFAWSFAPGNTARDLSHTFFGRSWPIVSFPVFWMLPKDFDASFFWVPFVANSIIWGVSGSVVIFLIRKTIR